MKEFVPYHLRVTAKEELDKLDRLAIDCFKAGKPYPKEWREYEDELNAILDGNPSLIDQLNRKLPEKPKKPAGVTDTRPSRDLKRP